MYPYLIILPPKTMVEPANLFSQILCSESPPDFGNQVEQINSDVIRIITSYCDVADIISLASINKIFNELLIKTKICCHHKLLCDDNYDFINQIPNLQVLQYHVDKSL